MRLAYDQLARLGFHRWWTPPLAILAAALAGIAAICGTMGAAAAVVALFGGHVDLDSDAMFSPLVDNITALLSLAVFIPVALIVARVVQRRPMRTLHSVAGRLRWRWLALCAGIATVFAVALMVVSAALYDEAGPWLTIGRWQFLGLAVLLVVLVPLQSAGEEYLTRGLLLQTLGSYARWAGIAGSALLFAAMHGWGTWTGFLALFAGAVVWAGLVIRTGGLEVSIAAHAMSNLLAFLTDAATGGMSTSIDTTLADAPPALSLVVFAGDAGYAVAILLTLRLLRLHRPGWLPATYLQVPEPAWPVPSESRLPISDRPRGG